MGVIRKKRNVVLGAFPLSHNLPSSHTPLSPPSPRFYFFSSLKSDSLESHPRRNKSGDVSLGSSQFVSFKQLQCFQTLSSVRAINSSSEGERGHFSLALEIHATLSIFFSFLLFMWMRLSLLRSEPEELTPRSFTAQTGMLLEPPH